MATVWRWRVSEFKSELERTMMRRMRKAVNFAERQVRKKLSGQRSGRTYTQFFFIDSAGQLRAFGSRPPHQASAPGEPPAVDTSNLRDSLSTAVGKGPTGLVKGFVGTHVIYGVFLELGTEGPPATGGMEPRPWLMPTIRENNEEIMNILGEGAA